MRERPEGGGRMRGGSDESMERRGSVWKGGEELGVKINHLRGKYLLGSFEIYLNIIYLNILLVIYPYTYLSKDHIPLPDALI